jgi:phosphoadenosine phosphosulfate reductase
MNKALPGMQLAPSEQSLERKIELAIKLLKAYEEMALKYSENGFYLAFSGGKDSIVIKELAKMAGIKFKSFYNQTTIDPPELIYFIREHHAEVAWNRPNPFINLVFYPTLHPKGPPTRLNRWCCQIYKEGGGDGLFKIIGVRAAESPRRAKQWKQVVANRRKGHILCPILYWTDNDVWQFIKERSLPYCCLYDEGFNRLGCIGCPISGTKGVERDFKRWPGFERLWKIGIKAYYDRWKDVPRRDGKERWLKRFDNWQELWDWWISRKKWKSKDEECQFNLLQI